MAVKCEKCETLIDGRNGQMVMIKDRLWLSIANKKDLLCPTCIEKRLGRKITSSDLKFRDQWSIQKFGSNKIPVNELYAKENNLTY